MQSLRPVVDPREMAGSAAGTARLLRDDTTLSCGYRNAFGSSPGGSDEKLLVDAAKALAAFQETLITPRTPFDDFRDALARVPLQAEFGEICFHEADDEQLAMMYGASRDGRAFIVPYDNAQEAALVEDARVYGARDLLQVCAHFAEREAQSCLLLQGAL